MGTKQLLETSAVASHSPEDIEMSSFPKEDWQTEQDEFSRLVETYSDFAYSVARRILPGPEDAEDAVQDAFLSAYRAFPFFKGQSKVSTWLYQIVVNACLMKIRKGKSRARYLIETNYDDAGVSDLSCDPEHLAINSELGDMLGFGLWQLVPDVRTAVVLRDIQGHSNQSVAETLQVSISCVKSRVHRGRVFLRKYMEEYLSTPPSSTPAGPVRTFQIAADGYAILASTGFSPKVRSRRGTSTCLGVVTS